MIKLSSHQQQILQQLAKKAKVKPEQCLLELLLAEYKLKFRKDYLL